MPKVQIPLSGKIQAALLNKVIDLKNIGKKLISDHFS